MNISKVGIIISSEYSRRVRKKSFLLTTFLMPFLFGLCFAVPTIIMLAGDDQVYRVRIFDDSGIMAPYFESKEGAVFDFAAEGESSEELRKNLKDNDLYAVVEISAQNADGEVTVTAYSDEPLNMELKHSIARSVNKAVEDYKLGLYKIGDLDKILEDVQTDIKVNAMTMTEEGDAKEDSVEVYMIVAYVLSLLIYMVVLLFGNSVMKSVIEEKTSRVVEVLVSSVKSVELMMGKIVGVALVALTQMAIWFVMIIAIMVGISTVASDKLADEQQVVTQGIEMMAQTEGGAAEIMGIMDKVQAVDWGLIVFSFLIYFVLGYMLYASMFAAVGAAVDSETDTNQLSLPVTAPLMIGLFVMLHTFEHPSSQLSIWCSIIPWTSPMVMLARIPFGTVPGWQILVSIVLLLVTFVATAYLSARIYRIGILSYGKKSSFKDLWKWMKTKK